MSKDGTTAPGPYLTPDEALAEVIQQWFPGGKTDKVTVAAAFRRSLQKRGYDLEDIWGRDLTNG